MGLLRHTKAIGDIMMDQHIYLDTVWRCVTWLKSGSVASGGNRRGHCVFAQTGVMRRQSSRDGRHRCLSSLDMSWSNLSDHCFCWCLSAEPLSSMFIMFAPWIQKTICSTHQKGSIWNLSLERQWLSQCLGEMSWTVSWMHESMLLKREAPVSTCPGQLPRLRDLYSGPQDGWAGSSTRSSWTYLNMDTKQYKMIQDDTRCLACEGHFEKQMLAHLRCSYCQTFSCVMDK